MPHVPTDPQEQRFQLLVNAVVDYAIYMIDTDGIIVTWNAGARRFKGYEADEIIGRPYASFFPAEDRAAGLPEKILATAATKGGSRAKAGGSARTAPASGPMSSSTRSATRPAL